MDRARAGDPFAVFKWFAEAGPRSHNTVSFASNKASCVLHATSIHQMSIMQHLYADMQFNGIGTLKRIALNEL